MDNSIYIALSRQLSLFKDMDATANNIANANTTGYGAEHILFNSYVTNDINQGDRNPMAFATEGYSYRDLKNGSVKITGNDLDVAISGDGYFTVETPLGIRYTRSGNFRKEGDGTLVTAEGYPVLDSSEQHIVFDEAARVIQIGDAGNIKVNGEDFGSLGIAQFSNPQLLERLNNQLFKSNTPPEPPENVHVMQGSLENSNVEPILELTHMLDVSHKVSDTAQFVAILYDLERKTSDAWAQQS